MTTLLGLSIAESTFNIVFLSYSDFLNMASANDILSVETRFIASLIYRVFILHSALSNNRAKIDAINRVSTLLMLVFLGDKPRIK